MFMIRDKMKLTVVILISCMLTFSTDIFAANESDPSLVSGNNEFALNLYSQIKNLPEIKQAEGNMFFSPYSISTALAMTYTGARGNTAKEMSDVLKFPSLKQEEIASAFGELQNNLQADKENRGYQLNVANALWGQQGFGFLNEYLEFNKKYYGSELTELDFAKSEEARKTINTWVEDKTNDKIKDLIPSGSIDSMTRMVLTNAIYFKGDWSIQFKEENTEEADFNVTKDKKVKAQMMYQKEKFDYAELDNMQLLQLPYKGEELSMLILLPKTIDALESVEAGLKPDTLAANLKQMRKREVDVYLPKFKITCGTIEMKGILGAMGMKDAFSAAADFSGMNGQKNLYISAVMHKAFVEVNEEGTEAAAATGVGISLMSIPMPPPVFRADRPFIFMIRDNASQSILFIGKVCNPELKN